MIFQTFSICQIRMDKITQVDALANLRSTIRKAPFDVVPLVHLIQPYTHNGEQVYVLHKSND